MAAYSSSSTTSRRSSGPVLRSVSPSTRLNTKTTSSSSFASSTATAFSNTFVHHHNHHHHHHHHRAASPTRVNLFASSPSPSSSIRFTMDRSTSPSRSMSARPVQRPQKKACMCSPTNHPGSFRCSLHKNFSPQRNQTVSTGPYQSNRLYARRSAMTNSLVRIGTVEGDLVKRALSSLIRPSSHHQRRRGDFQPTKSRLSVMS